MVCDLQPVCVHEWYVVSTALADLCLIVHCPRCNATGKVDGPTKEEWSQAFHAPSKPYRWYDNAAVSG